MNCSSQLYQNKCRLWPKIWSPHPLFLVFCFLFSSIFLIYCIACHKQINQQNRRSVLKSANKFSDSGNLLCDLCFEWMGQNILRSFKEKGSDNNHYQLHILRHCKVVAVSALTLTLQQSFQMHTWTPEIRL